MWIPVYLNTDSGKWHKSVLNKSGISVQMIPEQVFKCFRNDCSDPAGICTLREEWNHFIAVGFKQA